RLVSLATYGSWGEFPWGVMAPIMFAFGLALLIACSNIAMMQTARALARWGEIGGRYPQGVSRGRIVRQLVTESLPLIIAGGALGLVFSHLFIVLLRRVILYPEVAASQVFAVTLDVKIVCCSLFLTLIACVIVGLLPALQATRVGLISTLK